jgi:hypothetical protein
LREAHAVVELHVDQAGVRLHRHQLGLAQRPTSCEL